MKKKIIIWIAVFIFSLVGISFFGGPVPYIFFWITLLLPLVSLVYIGCVIASLKIYQRSDGRDMVCRSPSDFYITLQNEGWIPFSSLRLRFYSSFSSITDLEDSVIYELPPHSSLVKKTRLICKYRGVYDVGLKSIVVTDFLRFFSITYTIREPLNIIVAPARIKLHELRNTEELSESDHDKDTFKTRPSIPVREYVEGDDIRFLHWKASAVTQKLMVRELVGEEKTGVALIMDPKRYAEKMEDFLPAENKVVEIILALSWYYMEKNIPLDVFTMDSEMSKFAIRGAGDYDTLYEKMSRFFFYSDAEFLPLLEELFASGSLGEHHLLILVLQHWTQEDREKVEMLNAERLPIKVFLVEEEKENAGERPLDPDAVCVRIRPSDELEEVL